MDPRFYEAAVSQDLETLSRLANDHPGVVDAVTPMGDNALHIALRRPVGNLSPSLINNLPQSLLSLLTQANKEGETPLHAALKAGNNVPFVCCVETLLQPDGLDLERGQLPSSSPDADHEAGEEPRKSLLYLAAEAGSLEAVRVLLRSPWPWAHDSRGPKGSTALHSAIIHGHTEVQVISGLRRRRQMLEKEKVGSNEISSDSKCFGRLMRSRRFAEEITPDVKMITPAC